MKLARFARLKIDLFVRSATRRGGIIYTGGRGTGRNGSLGSASREPPPEAFKIPLAVSPTIVRTIERSTRSPSRFSFSVNFVTPDRFGKRARARPPARPRENSRVYVYARRDFSSPKMRACAREAAAAEAFPSRRIIRRRVATCTAAPRRVLFLDYVIPRAALTSTSFVSFSSSAEVESVLAYRSIRCANSSQRTLSIGSLLTRHISRR